MIENFQAKGTACGKAHRPEGAGVSWFGENFNGGKLGTREDLSRHHVSDGLDSHIREVCRILSRGMTMGNAC